MPTSSAAAAIMLPAANALLDPASKLTVKGPAIWPTAKAAVIMPTPCEACAPAALDAFVKSEIKKWGDVVKADASANP